MLIGFFWPWLNKMSLGKLPGDLSVKTEHYSVYFPIVTCLLLSFLLSGIMWLWKRFF